jgi:hypothetical protein
VNFCTIYRSATSNRHLARVDDVLMPMRLLLSVVLVAFVVAACQAGGAPAQTAGPALVAIPTAEPMGARDGCMDALMTGVLAADPDVGLVVEAPDGTSVVVVWPNGWAAVDQDGMRLLLNDGGDPIARVGDHVQIGGGHGGDGRWYTCGEVTVAP